MNKTNWKAQLGNFAKNCGSYLKDFPKDLGRIVGSWLWSAMLALCIASTIMTARESQNVGILCGLWLLAWVLLRVIRFLTVHNMELFAGMVSPTSFQSAFVFITDGIISCFTLGKRLSEGGDISNPVMLIIVGALWMVIFLVELFAAIVRNHEKAIMAISALEEICTHFTDDGVREIDITAQRNDNDKKRFRWVLANDELDEEGAD